MPESVDTVDAVLGISAKQLLSERIVFVDAAKPDQQYELLRKKYKALNGVTKSHARKMADTSVPESVEGGLPKPSRVLFNPERLTLEWTGARPMGPGLVNLGNTCFLNSVLQCLTYTAPLVNYIESGEHTRTCRAVGFCAMCELHRHLTYVREHHNGAVRPLNLVHKMKHIGKHFHHGRQEDAHEFLRYLIEGLQKSCLSNYPEKLDVASKQTTAIHEIFGGFHRSQVKCMVCHYESNTYDPLLDVSLNIKNCGSLKKAFRQFVEPDVLDGANKYLCPRCKGKVRAMKSLTFHKPPNVLTVQLKRFEFGRMFGKIGRMVHYESSLNLRPYMSNSNGPPIVYELYGVVVHAGGSCRSGHYYCYVKSAAGLYYCLNDSSTNRVTLDTMLQQQAYLLFYVRQQHTRKVSKSQDHQVTSQASPALQKRPTGSFSNTFSAQHNNVLGMPVTKPVLAREPITVGVVTPPTGTTAQSPRPIQPAAKAFSKSPSVSGKAPKRLVINLKRVVSSPTSGEPLKNPVRSTKSGKGITPAVFSSSDEASEKRGQQVNDDAGKFTKSMTSSFQQVTLAKKHRSVLSPSLVSYSESSDSDSLDENRHVAPITALANSSLSPCHNGKGPPHLTTTTNNTNSKAVDFPAQCTSPNKLVVTMTSPIAVAKSAKESDRVLESVVEVSPNPWSNVANEDVGVSFVSEPVVPYSSHVSEPVVPYSSHVSEPVVPFLSGRTREDQSLLLGNETPKTQPVSVNGERHGHGPKTRQGPFQEQESSLLVKKKKKKDKKIKKLREKHMKKDRRDGDRDKGPNGKLLKKNDRKKWLHVDDNVKKRSKTKRQHKYYDAKEKRAHRREKMKEERHKKHAEKAAEYRTLHDKWPLYQRHKHSFGSESYSDEERRSKTYSDTHGRKRRRSSGRGLHLETNSHSPKKSRSTGDISLTSPEHRSKKKRLHSDDDAEASREQRHHKKTRTGDGSRDRTHYISASPLPSTKEEYLKEKVKKKKKKKSREKEAICGSMSDLSRHALTHFDKKIRRSDSLWQQSERTERNLPHEEIKTGHSQSDMGKKLKYPLSPASKHDHVSVHLSPAKVEGWNNTKSTVFGFSGKQKKVADGWDDWDEELDRPKAKKIKEKKETQNDWDMSSQFQRAYKSRHLLKEKSHLHEHKQEQREMKCGEKHWSHNRHNHRHNHHRSHSNFRSHHGHHHHHTHHRKLSR